MLYKIAHILRDKLGWLWNFIEWVNGLLFSMRYSKRLQKVRISTKIEGYEIIEIKDLSTVLLFDFFRHQPAEAFTFFSPHGFDIKSIKRLQGNKSFLGYALLDKETEKIAGYFFNRCFFHGVGYRGRMVDIDYRGKGLGTAMNRILNEVGFGIGLRLYETVSKDNLASYRSALSASNVNVVKELPNNEFYLEILPD